MSLIIFPSSPGSNVTLEPEWDYETNDIQNRNEHVSRSGRRYLYIWATMKRWKVPISFVTSQDASYINSWWQSGTALYMIDTLRPTVTNSVMILNTTLPVGKYVQPYTTLYAGDITLGTY